MTELIAFALFPALMAFAAVSDLATMTISNRISILLVASFFALAVWLGLPLATIAWHAGAGLGVLVVTIALFAMRQIGGGDAKLAAATALWVGPNVLLEYFLYAALIGGALTAAIVLSRIVPLPRFALGWEWANRLHDKKAGIPYGVALAAGGLVVYPATEIWQRALGPMSGIAVS
jgi:prepilin peptidase CpaA